MDHFPEHIDMASTEMPESFTRRVAVDIETAGRFGRPVILSAAVTEFMPALGGRPVLGRTLEYSFSIAEQIIAGRVIEEETIKWWASQPPEAVYNAWTQSGVKGAAARLYELVAFIGDAEVWGFGVDFDNHHLLSLARDLKVPGWSYRQNRCGRTLPLTDFTWPTERIGAHTAIGDAVAQASAFSIALEKLRVNK